MRLVFLPRSISISILKIFAIRESLILLSVCLLAFTLHAQSINFTTNPVAVNNTITICKNQQITYTNTSTGISSTSSYNWSFQGGNPLTASTSGPHTVTYATAGNYTTTLTVGSLTHLVNVVVLNNDGYSASLSLNPIFNSLGFTTIQSNNSTVFRYCGTLIPYNSTVQFEFVVPLYPSSVQFTVNWGDGNSNTYTGGVTTISHVYNCATQNLFALQITVTTNNSCSSTANYTVFTGLSPTIQIFGNGSSACMPNTYNFNLQSNNIPNSTYEVIFNDNSSPLTLLTPFNPQINHTFDHSSCGTTSVISGQGGTSISYSNAFAASIIARNFCGETFSTIGPIYVSESVDATFTVAPGDSVCQYDDVVVTNTSIKGANVSAFGCDSLNKSFWRITPTTGFTLTNGTLGAQTGSYWPFWTQGSDTLNLQFTTPGTYQIALKIANGCNTDSLTKTIVVKPIPIVPNQSANICSGGTFTITPIEQPPTTIIPPGTTYTWTAQSNTQVFGEQAGSGNVISGTLLNTSGNTQQVFYTVTPITNGCPGPIFTVTILVIPGVLIPDQSQTICNNSPFTVSPVNSPPLTIVPFGTSYTWTAIDNPLVTGEASGAGFELTQTLNATVLSPTQTVVYQVVATAVSQCPTDTFWVNVTLNTIGNATIGTDQIICANGDPAVISFISPITAAGTLTYQWQISTDNVSWSSIAGATSASYDPPPGLMTSTYYRVLVVTTLNGNVCAATSNAVLVTVNTVTAPVISANQTICSGGDPQQLLMSSPAIASGTISYQWQYSTNNSSWASVAGATSTSYDPPSGQLVTTYYRLQATSDLSGSLCSNTSQVITITVNNINPNTIAANQTICFNGNPAAFTVTTPALASGTISYSWETSTDNAIWTAIVGATSATYDPPAGLTSTTYYRVVVTSTLNGTTCSAASNIALVTINQLNAPIIAADQTICSGGNPNEIVYTTPPAGLGTYTYQWQSSLNNVAWTPISGATSATYDPPSGLLTSTYFKVVVSSVLNTNSCPVPSNSIFVLVNQVTPGDIASNQTICSGGDANLLSVTTAATASGVLSYQWQVSADNVVWNDIAGATTATYDPTTQLTANVYYRRVAISDVNGVSCSATSNVILITIVPDPTITVNPLASQTICVGGSIPLALAASYTGGTGTVSYQWVETSASSTTLGSSASFTPTTFTTPGTYTYQVNISLTGVGCDATSSQTAVITVVADPTINTQPIGATYCQNASPVTALNVVAVGGTGTFSYQWFSNTANSTTGGTTLIGATTASYTPSVATIGTLYYYCIISQTAANCQVTTSPVAVMTTPGPNFTTQPTASQTVCIGGAPSSMSVAYANGTGTPSYQWYSNTVNNTTTGTAIISATTASFTPPTPTAAGTTYYYCVIQLAGGGCSQITSAVGQVIVNPDPAITVNPLANQTICVGGSIPVALTASYTGGTGTVSYQWVETSASSTTLGSSASFTPTTFTTPGTYTYQVNISLTGVGCDATSSQTAVITVVADPTINTQPVGATYCQNASPVTALSVVAVGGTGTFSYQWYSNTVNSTSGGTTLVGATAASYTPSVATIGTLYYYCIISQTGANCQVITSPVAVMTTPGPNFTTQPTASQTVCIGGTPNSMSVAYANGTGTPSYQWYSNTVNNTTTGTAIISATTASFTPPTPTAAGTTYYYCVIQLAGGGCSQITSAVGQVIVNPDPTITVNPLASQTICVGGSIPVALTASYTGGTGTVSYQWVETSAPSTTLGNSATFTPTAFATPGTYSYQVNISLTGVGCDATSSQTAVITVVADPTINTQPVGATYCQNASPVTALSVVAVGGTGTFSYQWYSNTVNSTSGGTTLIGATAASYTPSVATIGTTYYYCIISQTGANCQVTTSPVAVMTTPGPNFTTQPTASQTVCIGGAPSSMSVAYANGTGTPSYQWYSNTVNNTTTGTAIISATTASFTPQTPTAAGTTYYYCVIQLAGGGCSQITSAVGQVIVNPDPTITVNPLASQTICVGGSIPVALTASYSGGTGTVSYQWVETSASSTTLGSSASFTPTTFTTPGTYTYQVNISLTGVGCDATSSQTAVITVVADPTINTQPIGATYCQNASPVTALSVVAVGGTGTFSYQWYSNTANSTTGGTTLIGATAASYTPSVATIGTLYYYCIISQTGANCQVITSPVAVMTTPGPNFTTQPTASQTVCIGGTPNSMSVAYANGTGTPSYQWYSNTVNNTTTGTAIVGATTASFTPPTPTAAGTTYYYCVIQLAGGGCSQITSAVGQVIVNPDPTITVNPLASQTICVGGSIPVALTASYTGGTGTVSYQWVETSASSTTLGSSASFTPTAFATPGTYSYQVNISLTGVGCDATSSQTAVITVVADPTINTQPIGATYCQNASPVTALNVVAVGGTGTFSYQWYSNTANSTTGGTTLIGATAASYTPSVATIGTLYYYCVISQTGANCQVTTSPVAIVTLTPPSISAHPVSTQTICVGSTPSTLSVSYINGTGTPNYQWYSNPTNSTLNGTPISGATGSSYSPPQQTSAGSIYYYCVIQLSAGGCSSMTSTTAAIHVNGVNAGIIGTNQILCFGTASTPLVALSPATGSGTLTYVWQNAASTNYTTISGATAASYSPGVLSASQNYQLIVRSTLNGFVCLDTTNNVSITINPLPQLTNAPTQIICNNEQLNIVLSATINSSYSWHALPNASINGETTTNQSTGLIADSLSNTSTTAQFITYIITPTSLTQGCVGPLDTIIVQVQPTIGLTLPPTITICSGLPVNALLSANVASSFQWFVTLDNPNVTGESLSPSSVAYINDYLVNTTSVNQLVVYSVVPVSLAGACNGAAQTLAVLVKPPIQLINPDTIFICSGTSVNLPLVANTAVTFNWYADQQPNVLNETINLTVSSSIQDVLINTTNATQEVIYHAIGTTTTNGCSSPLVPISVFVEPLPVVTTLGITICSDEPVNLPLNASLTSSFSWVASPSSPVMGESLSLQYSNQLSDVLTNNSTTQQPVNYSITPTALATGCKGPTMPITVLVNPLPLVLFQLITPVLCNDLPIQFDNLSVGNIDFNWDFGNGNNSTIDEPVTLYTSFGPQSITLTGTDQQTGCQNSFTQIVQLQESPIVDFSVSDSIGCVVMNTTFTDNMNANGTTTFIDFGDGQSAFVNGTIDHQYLNAGCYDVTMTVSNTAGCVVTAQQQNMVCVYDYPIADFSASQDTVFTTDTEIEFTNQSVGATYYNWSFGDGQTSVATNPTHFFPETAGNYPVTLYVYNEGNCLDTARMTIMVWEELLAYVPNAFTPDANEFNNVFLPVFTAGFDPSSYHLTIFNRWGEVLFESFDSTVGWDGSYNGKIMKQDTYAWKIEFSPLQNDDQIIKMGHVTLLK